MTPTDPETPDRTCLLHLSLKNYRLFAELELDLDPFVNVLVAPNGGGKTAVLDAIAISLRYFVDTLQEAKSSHGFDRSDIRRARTENGSTVELSPTCLSALATVDGRPTNWRRELTRAGGRTTYVEAKELQHRALSLLGNLRDYADKRPVPPPNLPVIAYYGTGRLWDEGRLSTGKEAVAQQLDQQVSAYLDCLNPASSYRNFLVWFKAVAHEALKERDSDLPSRHRPQVLLDAVRQATDAVLAPTGWRGLDWDFIAGEVEAEHPAHGRLPVSLLSDGIRNTLAIVADLAQRCVRLNPHHGAEAARRSPGIVLIDEVDMHLHPEWQQTILDSLRVAFPMVQLIVTTHSPQLVSTAFSHSVRVLSADGRVRTPAQQTRGVESPTVLATVMGVDPIPPVKEARWVRDYQIRVELETHEEAEGVALWTDILAHYGPGHPVVLDCERLVRLQGFRARRRAALGG